jgi:crotonobetainyl-CoA:carnitine CoA-transferase CaiB-like acyl-CoA transferase
VSLPLDGSRILDLTRLLPGNYGTLLLADLGADVIKVEEPGRGDYMRWTPPMVGDESAVHRALNRGKRSVTVNLKSEAGRAVLLRLAAGADALLESFRPGVMDRLGVGYDALRSDNERLVYCAITGYGQDGPYRDRVGHDINYIGYSGLLHATGLPGGPPVLPAVQVGDFGGGMAAALGTVAAVGEARRTGRGRFVDVSMLDVVTSWMGVLMSWYLATGEVPPRGGMPLSGGLACYRVYRTSDGKHLAVGALEPRFWKALCDALEIPELVDRHFGPPGSRSTWRAGSRKSSARGPGTSGRSGWPTWRRAWGRSTTCPRRWGTRRSGTGAWSPRSTARRRGPARPSASPERSRPCARHRGWGSTRTRCSPRRVCPRPTWTSFDPGAGSSPGSGPDPGPLNPPRWPSTTR